MFSSLVRARQHTHLSTLLFFVFVLVAYASYTTKPRNSTNYRSITIPMSMTPAGPSSPNSRRGVPHTLHFHDRNSWRFIASRWLYRMVPHYVRTNIIPSSHPLLRAPIRTNDVPMYGGITVVGEYYIQIDVGGQKIRVQIDTGSSTMALPLEECSSCRKGDWRYSHSLSQTGLAQSIDCDSDFCRKDSCSLMSSCPACSQNRQACCFDSKNYECAFFLKYGDGSGASGALKRDLITWSDSVSANTVFGGILKDSPDFERSSVDGILGMAYKALACNPTCITPPFDELVEQNIVSNVFTLCMTTTGGVLTLGDYQDQPYTNHINWAPLVLSDPPYFYSVSIGGFLKIGSRSVELPNFNTAIVDSGTTLIIMSSSAFNTIVDHLHKYYCSVADLCSQNWFRPSQCVFIDQRELEALPSFVFTLGGSVELDLKPEDYLINYGGTGHRCVGIMTMDIGAGIDVILGNTAMIKYATIYDRKNSRIGFVETDGNCNGKKEAQGCSSHPTCEECAAAYTSCRYNYNTHQCEAKLGGILGHLPYPYCSGSQCFCSAESWLPLGVAIVAGVLGGALLIVLVVFGIRSVRERRQYAQLQREPVFTDHPLVT